MGAQPRPSGRTSNGLPVPRRKRLEMGEREAGVLHSRAEEMTAPPTRDAKIPYP